MVLSWACIPGSCRNSHASPKVAWSTRPRFERLPPVRTTRKAEAHRCVWLLEAWHRLLITLQHEISEGLSEFNARREVDTLLVDAAGSRAHGAARRRR